MVDLILFAAIGAAFYGGFKCGNKFASLGALWAAVKAKMP